MLGMKRQDLEELYQLLELYERTYGEKEAEKVLAKVEEDYRNIYGEKIGEKRNPRKAGRKRKYTEVTKGEIHKFRREGLTIREIAKETGCSVGYVQSVLSEP